MQLLLALPQGVIGVKDEIQHAGWGGLHTLGVEALTVPVVKGAALYFNGIGLFWP